MKENLKEYLEYIDKVLKDEKIEKDLPTNHLTQIKFWQHERLVHLIVTVFVGSMAILFFLFANVYNIILYIPFLATMVLFIPYIFYYYFLENSVQKLYKQYWSLLEKRTKDKFLFVALVVTNQNSYFIDRVTSILHRLKFR